MTESVADIGIELSLAMKTTCSMQRRTGEDWRRDH